MHTQIVVKETIILTNRHEILAFLGALFLKSVKQGNRANLSEYFTTNRTGFTILRADFSENRFWFLIRSNRFDNVNTRKQRMNNKKLASVWDILTDFIKNFQILYSLGEFVTVNEMLVIFQRKIPFYLIYDKNRLITGSKCMHCVMHAFFIPITLKFIVVNKLQVY